MIREKFIDRLRKKYQSGGIINRNHPVTPPTAEQSEASAGTLKEGRLINHGRWYRPEVWEAIPRIHKEKFNNIVEGDVQLKYQEGGMYNQMHQYQMGGQQLPGGEMQPIPGSDAVQFNGQSHDQGGIMLDGQTEVEGGETMDQVTMAKNGGKRSDYFFSDHLKKGGVSYANMHKEILAEGGDQREINMLAQMQEKAAGRDPNQVAKLGGVVKYENGGPQSPNSNQRTQNVQAAADPDYIAQMNELLGLSGNNLIEDDGMSTEDREARRNARRPQVADQNKRKLKNLQLFVDQGRELTAEQQLEYDTLYQSSTNYGAPVPANQTPTYSDAELSADMEEADDPDAYSAEQGQTALATITQREYEKSPEGIQAAKDAKKAARKLARTLNPGMPTEAKIGAGAQFLPAVTAMLTKQKSAEEYKYENGFEAPIVAGRVKGQTYDAPTQNEARARLASSYTGEQKFLDTSGAGAAGLSNRQALFAKKLQAEGTLGAQESRDAITAENLTKKSAEQANIRNVQNELTASTTNAQMIQKEADRKTAVDNANVQLRNMQEQEKISNRMNIVNNLSQGVAGVMGDTMAYKSQERMAKAVGGDGIYQRDILSNYLAKQPGNENKSKEEINQMVLKIYNA